MGKILWVDLSKQELKDEALDEKTCRQYLGGYGLGARILFSRQKAGVDPLGPDNIFGFTTGVLTGTSALGGSRYICVGKSPLTGGWGDANSGGSFGPGLKFAGYDAVFFTGQAAKPVYLLIDSGKAELKDASNLWSKDSFATEDMLRDEHGKDVEIACIGPSGEAVSLIAAIMNNKGRAAARSGLGAVMGSKKLKAVVAKGKMAVPVADDARVKGLRSKYLKELTGPLPIFRDFGTSGMFNASAESGDAPTKNWDGTSVIDFKNYADIGGDPMIERQAKKYACYRCPIGCGGHMKAGTGEYKYEEGAHKPEYETQAMFGSDCLNGNIESIIMANDICNRAGLDTISAAATIAFAIECYEKGVITKEDTGGIEMTWGNHKSIIAMLEKMARREGFGAVLADGAKKAAERIGKGAEKLAMHIQGQEMPAHDPKVSRYLGVTYRMDATPGRHTQGSEALNPAGLLPDFDNDDWRGRGEFHRIGSNFQHAMSAAGMCLFIYACLPNTHVLPEFISAITGWDITQDELIETGERIGTIRHAFNLREGLNPLEYDVNGRLLGVPPQQEGPVAGVTVPEADMVRDYLEAIDWDTKTAKPSRKKLEELGLEDVARALAV
jgi:aldehyde:ferredoxin oxidoreductase